MLLLFLILLELILLPELLWLIKLLDLIGCHLYVLLPTIYLSFRLNTNDFLLSYLVVVDFLPLQQDSNFSKLFKSISTILAVKDRSTLVMTYQSRKVYEFGTPSTLKIHSEATFKCYTKEIWLASENLRLNPVITSDVIVGVAVAVASTSNSLERERETSVLPSNVPTMNSNPEEESEATTTSIDLLKITIRGSSTQSFSLAVKKTMLVSQLLKQYCKKFEILDLDRINKMWLEFDGEKLEGSKMLKDFDEIEDEETVDVREGK